MEYITDLINTFTTRLQAPFDVSNRLFFPYILAAFIIASYITYKSGKHKISEIFSTLFPKEIYTHKSTRIDVLSFFINPLLLTAGLFYITVGANTVANVALPLFKMIGSGGYVAEKTHLIIAVYSLVYFIVFDFAQYVAHYLNHKIGFLWEFHKIHHSAEVMTPITAYRFHIFDLIFTMSTIAIFTGLVKAGGYWIANENLYFFNISGVQIGIFIFYIAAYNLRHSHIWFAYTPVLSHIFISPAQHQIHHSIAPKHWDKNMGFVLAIWDWMFGTLYVAKEKENISYGLDGTEEKEYNQSIFKCYILPFQKIFKMTKNTFSKSNMTLLAIAIVATSYPALANNDKLFIENMTWHEISEAIKKGKSHILIPTAGIEQNGLHLPLNKHEIVLEYTTQEIAKSHGNMLIAPIINHVPEGSISPKSGHMLFAGTISMKDETFAEILKNTANSFNAHGFTHIYFIGDSGGNQAVQKKVANELRNGSFSLFKRNVAINAFHLGDYYANKKQEEWLESKGYSKEEIGGHAGLRDTSEYIAATAEMGIYNIRKDKLKYYPLNSYNDNGSYGDSGKSSIELGKELLKIKIDLALKQIQTYTK